MLTNQTYFLLIKTTVIQKQIFLIPVNLVKIKYVCNLWRLMCLKIFHTQFELPSMCIFVVSFLLIMSYKNTKPQHTDTKIYTHTHSGHTFNHKTEPWSLCVPYYAIVFVILIKQRVIFLPQVKNHNFVFHKLCFLFIKGNEKF